MRIRYIIPFDRKLIIPDHWDIPFQGGVCRVVDENGFSKALEVVFTQQPTDYAPRAEKLEEGPVKLSITGRDQHLAMVKLHLGEAMSFLQCYFDIGSSLDEIEANYEGETIEEQQEIDVKSMTIGRHKPALPITFDLLTRAIMAAEKNAAPKFQATLVSTARKSLSDQQFINSFRYSFLLIESLFGEGQFKSAGLKSALKRNVDFRTIVGGAINRRIAPSKNKNSDTERLLANKPSVDDLIDHIVEKRGFYFHGNIKRKDNWKPEEQGGAESLALISVAIAQLIAEAAAEPVFDPVLSERHFHNAQMVGAMVVCQIKYKFREPEESYLRDGQLNVKMPGTKVTQRMALTAAKQFLDYFEQSHPAAGIQSAVCNLQGGSENIFEMKFQDM